MKGLLAICFVLLVVSAQYSVHAKFDCKRDVVVALNPCKPYLIGDAQKPDQSCCTAVQGLEKLFKVNDKKQRVAACQCIEAIAKDPNVKTDKAKKLPTFCKVNVSLDPNFDCSKA